MTKACLTSTLFRDSVNQVPNNGHHWRIYVVLYSANEGPEITCKWYLCVERMSLLRPNLCFTVIQESSVGSFELSQLGELWANKDELSYVWVDGAQIQLCNQLITFSVIIVCHSSNDVSKDTYWWYFLYIAPVWIISTLILTQIFCNMDMPGELEGQRCSQGIAIGDAS